MASFKKRDGTLRRSRLGLIDERSPEDTFKSIRMNVLLNSFCANFGAGTLFL